MPQPLTCGQGAPVSQPAVRVLSRLRLAPSVRLILVSSLLITFSSCHASPGLPANEQQQQTPSRPTHRSQAQRDPDTWSKQQDRKSTLSLISWAQALPHAFTKEKASLLASDVRQFFWACNVIFMGPYYRTLHTSWTKFTWRLARYLHWAGRTVTSVKKRAQWLHSKVLARVMSKVRSKPALYSILKSEQLVELLLLYGYSAVLALTLACLLGTCTSSRRVPQP